MQKEILNISARDGLVLFGQHWYPEGKPDLVICILHGFGGHSGHYENFSTYMTDKGHAVLGLDQRGHGKSDGRRGYIKSVDLLMSDINDFLIEARKTYLDLPIFLFGHSMGGLLVANYLIRFRSAELTGAVISSGLFRLAFKPPVGKIFYGRLFSKFYHGYTLSFNADPSQFSSSKTSGTDPLHDPLVHNKISYPLYKFFIESGPWAVGNAALNTLPTLVMHGENDAITSWQASREFCGNSGERTTFKLWKGFRHELHNEEHREEVFGFIDHWITDNTNHLKD